MKRLILLSVILLLLSGCTVPEEPAVTTAPTEPPISSLLDENAPFQEATGGAVLTYRIENALITGLFPMGDGLLTLQDGAATTLHLIRGTQPEITASAALEYPCDPADLLQVSASGVAIYRKDSRAIHFLDSALRSIRTLQLPADAVGDPAVSPDLNTVYYCTDQGIWATDLLSGISHPLQQNSAYADQAITGALFDGKMLRHEVAFADGSTETHLVSTETGEVLYSGHLAKNLFTAGQHYFLGVNSGTVTQLVFGSTEGTPGVLWPGEAIKNCVPIPAQNALMAVYPSDTACRLAYYDLDTGKHTADVTLPGVPGVYSLCSDASGRIWFCTYDEATRTTAMHCWDAALSPTGDSTVYTDTYYTRENPDTDGFAALETRLAELESTFGVDIILGEAAVQVQPWANSFTTEYLLPVYETWLPRLEAALQQFPEGFLSNTVSNGLHIVVVRSIQGRPENGYTDTVSGIQYWYDGGTYIALCLTDDPAPTLYHTLGYLIDSRVLTLTAAYKDWDKLNPKGFSYDNSYAANQNRNDWQYLQEGDRAFIDMFSMSFAREDRAQIFEYAMHPGNEAFFRSPTMQKKLQAICDGIRKAYSLTKDPRSFPWEQYLSRP